MRFRKKPIMVEAFQFTNQSKDRVYHQACAVQGNVYPVWEGDQPALRIPTAEGEMTCLLGDWLIVDPFPTDDRRIYPCKPDVFANTYEPVED